MGGDLEDEHLDRLLEPDPACTPPPAAHDPLGRLLRAAATPNPQTTADQARVSAGEDAAVAAFRAARQQTAHGRPARADPRPRKVRRVVLAGALAGCLAAALLAAAALYPHHTDSGHTRAPALEPLTTSPPGTGPAPSGGTSPRPLDNTGTTIDPLTATPTRPSKAQQTESADHATKDKCPGSSAHGKTPPGQSKAGKSGC
jgi:hypothetical protein